MASRLKAKCNRPTRNLRPGNRWTKEAVCILWPGKQFTILVFVITNLPSVILPVNNCAIISVPFTEIATLVVGEPFTSAFNRLLNRPTGVGALTTIDFPPLANETSVFTSSKPLTRFSVLTELLCVFKRIQKRVASPVGYGDAGDLLEGLGVAAVEPAAVRVADRLEGLGGLDGRANKVRKAHIAALVALDE